MMFSTLSDLDVVTLDADPPILDLPLPPPSSHISPDVSRHEVSLNTRIDLDNSSQESTSEYLSERFSANGWLKYPDLYRRRPPPLSEKFPLPPFLLPRRSFLSERDSFGSMDWPPIGSSLLPTEGNARRDKNKVLERRKSPDSGFSCAEVADPSFPDVVSDDDPKACNTLDAPPIWTQASPPSSPLLTSERQVDISLTPECQEARSSRQDRSSVTGTSTSVVSRHDVFERPPRITLPSISTPPARIHKVQSRLLTSPIPRIDYGDTEIGCAAPLVSLSNSAQDRGTHSAGSVQ
jgi:hypothetical protein